MNEAEGDLYDVVRQLKAELTWAARTGIEVVAPAPSATSGLPRAVDLTGEAPRPTPPAPPRQGAPERPSLVERGPPPSAPPRAPSRAEAERGAAAPPKAQSDLAVLGERPSLEQIRQVLGDCTRCKLCSLGRKQIVFGVGKPDAEIMFVGEGPGADEDRQGEPFVGAAGQLLTKIIEAGMGLRRADVYIANVLKCRPPNNRDPEPDEVLQCWPFVEAQIRAVQPRVIITLGRHAAHAVLKTQAPITRLRGKWGEHQGIPVMPTYHPAYLLRNPEEKRAVWEDVKEVLRRLDRAPPQRSKP